jgi:hypothetical protein
MIIYIVFEGEQHEGGSVASVHKTHAGAVNAAVQAKSFMGLGWTKDPEILDYWTSGCDFVEVVKRELEE